MLSSYQTLQRIILNDKSLHDLIKQRSHSYIQVAAVKRINQLLSTKIEMPKRQKYQIKCCGIDIPELSSLFDKDPIFCNKHWNYCKATDNWHAQECPLSVPLEKNTLETVGWKFDGDNARCSACVIGKKNAMQRYSQKIKDGSCVTTVDSLLKKQVNDAFDNHVGKCNDRNEGIANLKNNEDFVESMKILAAAKVNNVTCDEGKSLCRSCANGYCEEIMVVRAQSNNATTCGKCRSKDKDAAKLEKRRSVNYYKQNQENSHTNIRYLTMEQMRENLQYWGRRSVKQSVN